MKTCWIHIGMHKTGSTSVQSYLSAVTRPHGWRYVKVDGRSNMNQALFAAFDSKPERHPIFVKHGYSHERLSTMRVRIRERLAAFIRDCPEDKIIISAEMASLIDRDGVKELRDFLAPLCDEMKIVGYVRKPIGFKNSLFQEQVKHGKGTLKNLSEPRYRMRFEKYDEIFGAGNVILRLFDPGSFTQKCIVADFCEVVGLPVPAPGEVVRVNESLSREACGLLYAYRKFGPGYGVGEDVVTENTRLIEPMLQMSGAKFKFSQELAGQNTEREIEDLRWMEQRLGVSLKEKISMDGDEIASEEDLLRITGETCAGFAAKLLEVRGIAVPEAMVPKGEFIEPRLAAEFVGHCRELIRGRMLARRVLRRRWRHVIAVYDFVRKAGARSRRYVLRFLGWKSPAEPRRGLDTSD